MSTTDSVYNTFNGCPCLHGTRLQSNNQHIYYCDPGFIGLNVFIELRIVKKTYINRKITD